MRGKAEQLSEKGQYATNVGAGRKMKRKKKRNDTSVLSAEREEKTQQRIEESQE